MTIHVDDVNDHTPHFVRSLYRTTFLPLSVLPGVPLPGVFTMSHHLSLPCLCTAPPSLSYQVFLPVVSTSCLCHVRTSFYHVSLPDVSTMSYHVMSLYRTTMSESLTKGASVTSVSATDNDLGVNARLTYTIDVTLIS